MLHRITPKFILVLFCIIVALIVGFIAYRVIHNGTVNGLRWGQNAVSAITGQEEVFGEIESAEANLGIDDQFSRIEDLEGYGGWVD